jgi:hypothetical protein
LSPNHIAVEAPLLVVAHKCLKGDDDDGGSGQPTSLAAASPLDFLGASTNRAQRLKMDAKKGRLSNPIEAVETIRLHLRRETKFVKKGRLFPFLVGDAATTKV